MNDSDKCCYATINIESHGYMIRTNHEHPRKIEISDNFGIELLETSGPQTFNVCVKTEEFEKMVYDARFKGGSRSFIMVYRYGKTEAEVLEMVKPQLQEYLIKLKAVYEILVSNAQEMYDVTHHNFQASHICPPMK